jgi:hypothetical protein
VYGAVRSLEGPQLEPDVGVDHVVQPDRDQEPIYEPVEPGPEGAKAHDSFAEGVDPRPYRRPYQAEDHTQNQRGERRYYGHEPLPPEEAKVIGQPDVREPPVEARRHEAYENTCEHAHLVHGVERLVA